MKIAVCIDSEVDGELRRRLMGLAARIQAPVHVETPAGYDLTLFLGGERLEARWQGDVPGERFGPVFVDLRRLDVASGGGRSRHQPIARAIGLGRGRPAPFVADATAGYGDDSWLLASLGCRVVAVERSPIVAALLEDGLRRMEPIQAEVTSRIQLHLGDAKDWIAAIDDRPDVIYLDPMFPRGKKSALEEKRIRLLRVLVGDDLDAEELLACALQVARRRVVLKRPLHAPFLGGKPTTVYRGKSVRYDVYGIGPD